MDTSIPNGRILRDAFPMNPSLNDLPPRYQGPLLTVYQWEQPLSTGDTVTFERCVRPDTVAVIGFLDAKTILLTQEKQLGRTDTFIDVPGGRVDPGEDHEAAARRELREETGYEASALLPWETVEYGGLIRFRQSIYLAKGLTLATTPSETHDPTEEISLLPLPLEEAVQLCLTKNLRRAEVSLALLRLHYDPASKERLRAFLSDL
jgi:ADP-ribose pyrophosphatase